MTSTAGHVQWLLMADGRLGSAGGGCSGGAGTEKMKDNGGQ